MTLLVLATHPVQYHAPVYREVQQSFGIPVTVIYASDFSVAGYEDRDFGAKFSWDTDLLSGYTAMFLSRVADGGATNDREVSARGIDRLIAEVNPGAILVTGYRPRFDLRAFAAALRSGRPLMFRAETLDTEQTQRNKLKSTARDVFLKWFYARFDRLLYIGENARKHYVRLGVPEDKLIFSPYCVDLTPFNVDENARIQLRSATREQLQIGEDRFVMLLSGKLIPRKSPDLVLHAAKLLPEDLRSRIVMLFLGDGEMRASLAELANQLPQVEARFVGFQNQSQLSGYYYAADVMILASQLEPWGLVVNEALHHGLPCIVSDRVGSAPDLIREDVTGYIFQYGDTEGLKECIIQANELTRRPGTRSACRALVDGYTVQAAAAGIAEAYKLSLSGIPNKGRS